LTADAPPFTINCSVSGNSGKHRTWAGGPMSEPRLPPGAVHGQTRRTCKLGDFILTEAAFSANLCVGPHRHTNAFFRLILEGFSTDFSAQRSCTGGPATMVFHPAEERHSNCWHRAGRSLLIELPPYWPARVGECGKVLEQPADFSDGAPVVLALKLYGEFRHADAVSRLAMEGLVLELLAEASRQPGVAAVGHPRWLCQARDLLHGRFAEALTLDEVAGEVGVHPVHLSRAFRRFFRCTVGEYVRQLRIDFASKALAAGDASLVEIALAAGFADQSHFCNVFKRRTGLTPSQYRRKLRPR
jgi:AraC family transcriptional regulator